ncbi:enoyl-CoA hydratase/isomerase family protein [Exilibacterium tricleocarpae]|uniref:Enoyl-CoA hydratase/isomerase family protein n=1 Tax=Exilibacterium tricleocarpae TaxID=2591008 RepID=A0A545SMI2_9GAMM|nr:enoyl-CoA hydratase/isomerase family protein [Exilibacterium tricleocarpae]TQV66173.1 enoyl-CoA hydratase/isomerase family protein [Exilibacterium tricleocarpae]
MSETTVLMDIDARGVATITLNRADKHNAFDDAVIALLTRRFEAAAADKQVRAVVLAATGKSFSAGADLAWMQRMAGYSYEENRRDADALAQMLNTLNTLPKPTIARVQGAAFGGAVGLVGCCDMAVASRSASFCLSEVKIGLIPATISPYVIAAMGARAARRYFITAERFSAATAAGLGLVSEAVEAAQLDPVIDQWLEHILANSPAAIVAAKQLIADIGDRPITESLIADTSERIARIRVSAQGQEGLQAFLEKRKPNYRA